MSQPAHPTQKARVIIRHCDSYDPERIRQIVREGLEELDLRPFGRTLMKPNLVASGPLFENAHTRVEFAEGVMKALMDRNNDGKLEAKELRGKGHGKHWRKGGHHQRHGGQDMLDRDI